MASVSILLQGKLGFYIAKSSEGILFITLNKKIKNYFVTIAPKRMAPFFLNKDDIT